MCLDYHFGSNLIKVATHSNRSNNSLVNSVLTSDIVPPTARYFCNQYCKAISYVNAVLASLPALSLWSKTQTLRTLVAVSQHSRKSAFVCTWEQWIKRFCLLFRSETRIFLIFIADDS
jgi:hypothetical protein